MKRKNVIILAFGSCDSINRMFRKKVDYNRETEI